MLVLELWGGGACKVDFSAKTRLRAAGPFNPIQIEGGSGFTVDRGVSISTI